MANIFLGLISLLIKTIILVLNPIPLLLCFSFSAHRYTHTHTYTQYLLSSFQPPETLWFPELVWHENSLRVITREVILMYRRVTSVVPKRWKNRGWTLIFILMVLHSISSLSSNFSYLNNLQAASALGSKQEGEAART